MNLAKLIACSLFLSSLFVESCIGWDGIWAPLEGPDYVFKTDDIAIGYSGEDRYIFLADSCSEGSVLRRKNNNPAWENIAFGYFPTRISTGYDFGNVAVMMIPYAYSNRGVYFSFNADNLNPSQVSWHSRWFGLLMNSTTDLDVIQNSIDESGEHIKAFVTRGALDLVTEQKIFKTEDSGVNWQPQTDGIQDNFQFSDIEIYQYSPDYITTCGMYIESSGTEKPLVCRSTDEGVTWSVIGDRWSFNNPATGAASYITMSSKNTIYVSMISSTDAQNTLHQIWKTVDSGESWELKWEQINNDDYQIYSMLIANGNPDTPPSADTIIIGLKEMGIQYSTDGGNQWQFRNDGLCSSSKINALGQDPDFKSRLFGGPLGAVFQSDDLGAYWYDITKGAFRDKTTCLAKYSDLMYCGSYNGTRISVSPDNITSKTQVRGRYNCRVNCIRFEPNRPGYLWALSSKSFAGASFSEMVYTNEASYSCNNWITALFTPNYGMGWDLKEFDFTIENGLNCIWCCGNHSSDGVVKYTNDDGATWNDIFLPGGNLNSLSVNRDSQNRTLVASENGGVFRRIVGQNAFETINNGLTNLEIHKVLYQQSGTNTAYCGTLEGIFRSVNVDAPSSNSVEWQQRNYGLNNSNVCLTSAESGQIKGGN